MPDSTRYADPSQVISEAKLLNELEPIEIQRKVQRVSRRIDARLVELFEVPFATVPEFIQDATAKISAGELLRSAVSGGVSEVSSEAQSLITEGWALISDIKRQPKLLGLDVKPASATAADRDGVETYVPNERPFFTMDRPEEQPSTRRAHPHEGA